MGQDGRNPRGIGPMQADPGGARDGRRQGSVKRARLNVEAGLPPEAALETTPRNPPSDPHGQTIPPLMHKGRPFRRNEREEQQPSKFQQLPFGTPSIQPAKRAAPLKSAISRPKPALKSQWPLPEGASGAARKLNTSPSRTETGVHRALPPPRPKRPSQVPSLQAIPQSPISPSTYRAGLPFQSRGVSSVYSVGNGEDAPERPLSEMPPIPHSAGSSHPPSGNSSRPSTVSSVGSIPDFPVPSSAPSQATVANTSAPVPPPTSALPSIVTPSGRKSGNYRPPSARRGASSYYSQYSFVAPIPEERQDPQRSHGSFASSKVMPDSWGPNPQGRQDGGVHNDDDHHGEGGRISRQSDDDEERGLVRQASLGHRHRPALTTIKSLDRLGQDRTRSENATAGRLGPSADGGMRVQFAQAPSFSRSAESLPQPKPAARSRSSLSRIRNSFLKIPMALTTDVPAPAPSGSRSVTPSAGELRTDSAQREYRADSRNGRQNATPPFGMLGETGDSTLGLKRPPPLNMNSIAAAESRGSLTSLPDLIRRATTLASVLDRGRPETRLDGEFMPLHGGTAQAKRPAVQTRRSGNFNDQLDSFPSPGRHDGVDSRESRWPSPHENGNSADGQEDEKRSLTPEPRRRRCCGIPLWLFNIILLIGILGIVAAIVLPIVFIVLPRQRAASNPALEKCKTTSACANGGSSMLDGNTCRCICVNGFTGATCRVRSPDSCVTTDISSGGTSVNDATVGSSIPRLLQDVSDQFEIPLNSPTIISRFSANDLSCRSENALVTFNGLSSPASSTSDTAASRRAKRAEADRRIILRKRAPASEEIPGATTKDGIIFATATDSPSSDSSSGSSTDQPATVTDVPTPVNIDSPFSLNDTTFDFARVSVLYILEQSSFDKAVTAQSRIQSFLGTSQGIATLDVGDGMTVDFLRHTIDLGNGTIGRTGFI
ncbi:MAG: hypothetical protein M1825_004837 [Sarcosagium campestre]|nr:MAG: hypothetical protein M1825_004837 [Sarcosagium campestre]